MSERNQISQMGDLDHPSAEKQLAGRIISYVSSLPQKKLSWLWQLFANTLDNVDPLVPLAIKIEFKGNCVQFNHSGKMVSIENLRAIVNQSTTKNQQLGVGLMSLFALTPNVEVQGIVMREDEKSTFALNLQRPTDSINRLVAQIEHSKQSLASLPKMKQTQSLDKEMTTRFRLFTKESFDQEVEQLKSNLLFLFAFNKQLSRVEIIHKGKAISFQKPIPKNHPSGCKLISLDQPAAQVNGLLYIENGDLIVGLPVHEDAKSMRLQRVSNPIFRRYPLQQPLDFPFIVSSSQLKLDITRQQLKQKENNNIISQSFKLFYQLLPTIVDSVQSRQLLLQIKLRAEFQSLSAEYKQFIVGQPTILSFHGTYQKLSAIKFPLIQSANYIPDKFIKQTIQFFDFCNQFLTVPLNRQSYRQCLLIMFNDLNDWIKYIHPFELKEFLQNLSSLQAAKLIQTIQSIPKFSHISKQHLVAEYLNQLYKFLGSEFPYQLLNPANKIAFNSNNKFVKFKGLYQVQSPLPEPILRFCLQELGVDLKETLLAPGISRDIFDLDRYEVNDIVSSIEKKLNKQELEVRDVRSLFRFLTIYPRDDSSNSQANQLKTRKGAYEVFKYFRVFSDIQQQFIDRDLNIDYRPFVKKLMDYVFQEIGESLKDLVSLSRQLTFENQEDAIQWFNSFQQILNKIKYQKIYNKNLNRNNVFIEVENLYIADPCITDIQIKLFQDLPVEMVVEENRIHKNTYKELARILLHKKVNTGAFVQQNIKYLSVGQVLDSLVSKFKEEGIEVKKERSQMILDYCDDLEEMYAKDRSEALEQKIDLVKQVREETAEALGALRLTTDEDKQFIWRIMKEKEAYRNLKHLRREMNLQTIVKNAEDHQMMQQTISEKDEQIRRLRSEIDRVNNMWQSKIEENENLFKVEKSALEKRYSILAEENGGLKKKTEDLSRTYEKTKAEIEDATKNRQYFQLKVKQAKESLAQQEKQAESLKDHIHSLQQGMKKKSRQIEAKNSIMESKDKEIDNLKEQLRTAEDEVSELKQLLQQRENEQLRSEQQQSQDRQQEEKSNEQHQPNQQQSHPQPNQQDSQPAQQKPKSEEVGPKQKIEEPIKQMARQIVQEPRQMQSRESQLSQQQLLQQQKRTFVKSVSQPHQKSEEEELFESLTSYKYDKEIRCFVIQSKDTSAPRVYLMLFPLENTENFISHANLNKIYKIKTLLYICFVPSGATTENLLQKVQICSLQETGIDKHFSTLREAEAKQNAAIKKKVGKGGFWFQYIVNAKHPIKFKSLQEFKREVLQA